MSMQLNRIVKATALALLGLVVAGPVYAVDGVIEINQARALAGGVTTGDAPGFPVEIKSPGSYRLTGNLDLTATPPGLANPENTTAISVTAPDVTIDLNGFEIKGATSCSGAPAPSCSCTSAGSGRGIDGSTVVGVAVMNGTIRGMGSWGVLLGRQSRVERVRVVSNGLAGIMGAETVTNCTADGNGDSGISSADTVLDSTANENCKDGIIAANTVVNCTTRSNAANGIEGKTTANCTAVSNTGIGIVATTAIGCTVTNNMTNLSATGVVGHNVCGPPLAACP